MRWTSSPTRTHTHTHTHHHASLCIHAAHRHTRPYALTHPRTHSRTHTHTHTTHSHTHPHALAHSERVDGHHGRHDPGWVDPFVPASCCFLQYPPIQLITTWPITFIRRFAFLVYVYFPRQPHLAPRTTHQHNARKRQAPRRKRRPLSGLRKIRPKKKCLTDGRPRS